VVPQEPAPQPDRNRRARGRALKKRGAASRSPNPVGAYKTIRPWQPLGRVA